MIITLVDLDRAAVVGQVWTSKRRGFVRKRNAISEQPTKSRKGAFVWNSSCVDLSKPPSEKTVKERDVRVEKLLDYYDPKRLGHGRKWGWRCFAICATAERRETPLDQTQSEGTEKNSHSVPSQETGGRTLCRLHDGRHTKGRGLC